VEQGGIGNARKVERPTAQVRDSMDEFQSFACTARSAGRSFHQQLDASCGVRSLRWRSPAFTAVVRYGTPAANRRPPIGGMIGSMDVLSSRTLLRPADPERSRRFYRDMLGLAVYREFGDRDDPGLVFFLGGGHLEVSGVGDGTVSRNLALWLQVRDLAAEHRRLQAAGVEILRAPEREPWGLAEMWITDPDGVRIVLVEVPTQHPLRRDNR
jgi:catechol 2,3-dioxygenase-like lactoylglutathione lyase family enzyme